MIARMAVSTRGLVKRYGARRALDGFSLDVPVGTVLGLVGPNGAGKTTWMMSVAGLLQVQAGEISIFGTSGGFDATRHSGRVAILPQDSELPLESTPRSFLCSLARLSGQSAAAARADVEAVLAAVNLADRARQVIRSLSHGMRKRLMAAQCFLGRPELILLDEPMNGLDPEEALRLRELIRSRAASAAIVISSHQLLDLERLVDQVAFVNAGRVVKVASVAELTAGGGTLESAYLAGMRG